MFARLVPGRISTKGHSTAPDFFISIIFPKNLTNAGTLFFVADKRGVDTGGQPPFYDKTDREKFRKVVPNTSAQDIASAIKTLRHDERLKKSRIFLFGWREETIIAALVAADKEKKISVLLLAGHVHENITDVIRWQNEGESSMRSEETSTKIRTIKSAKQNMNPPIKRQPQCASRDSRAQNLNKRCK